MKNSRIYLVSLILALLIASCEKTKVTPDPTDEKGPKTLTDDDRISFLKSTGTANSDYDGQQEFTLSYIVQLSETEIGFVVDYKIGESYYLHEFDIVWDGKLVTDADNNLWMNLEIVHQTNEKNPQFLVSDSALIYIPDLAAFDEETTSKLWLRFINTTDITNVLTLKYQRNISTNQDGVEDGTGTTPSDSTLTEGYSVKETSPQDSNLTIIDTTTVIATEDATETDGSVDIDIEPILQDSLQTDEIIG
jgi:hypothetical protein